jgi:hypothetical protein
VSCAPIKVDVPQLDDDSAAAARGINGKAAAAAAAGAGGGPTSWHQLWGAGAYEGVLPNAAAGSFLLGEGRFF